MAVHNFRLSSLILLFFLVSIVAARFCIHNEKGWCQGHSIWGWCFHNKSSGAFDCDENGFCASQEALKNKKSSGCFARENSSVCCCNDADGCNLGFIGITPKYAHGQQCVNSIEVPNDDIRQFRACDDPYCYSLLSAEEDGGPTTAIRGCHSRKLVMHHMSKTEDEKFNNNTKWRETEQLAKLPTCSDILKNYQNENRTTSLCVDFGFEQEDEEGELVKMKGRLCCCEGSSKCNSNQLWSDEGISLVELEEKIRNRNAPKSQSANVDLSCLLLPFLGFFVFFN